MLTPPRKSFGRARSNLQAVIFETVGYFRQKHNTQTNHDHFVVKSSNCYRISLLVN